MGKEFYDTYPEAQAVWKLADKVLQNLYWQDKREVQAESGHPYSMEQLTFEENPYINITEYTQIAMLTMEVAILKVLEAKGLKAEMAAGLSLGEYGALAAAGVMELPDLFRIIRMRGIYMQEAYPEGGAMAAILGLDGDTVAKICGQTAKETGKVVSVANYNCPGQIVITGEADAVAAASEALKEAAKILIHHFMLFSDEKIAIETADTEGNEEFDEEVLHMRQLLKSKLADMDLSVRALNCLKAADVETLGELVKFNKNDLLKFRNFGKKSLTELDELLESLNLSFGMDITKYKLDKE